MTGRPWLRHAGALGLFAALAVVHTWPLAQAPGAYSRHDNGDAVLNEWAVAWVAHQAPRDPRHLFDANIFYPEKNTLAFSEHLLVQGLMGAPLLWAGFSTTAVHNVLLLVGLTLSGWAMYLVMMRWTGDPVAAVLSGCLMAFNAHTLTRLAHLQAMHLEFLPLAVLALDRLLDEPRWRHAAALAAFFVLQGLTSNYLLVFTSFAMIAGALARPEDWWGRRIVRVVGPAFAAALLAVAATLPFLMPYYWASQRQGLARTAGEILRYSASWRDYLITGGRLHYGLWSHRLWEDGPTALFPGIVAAALAAVAIAAGVAWRDRRARMWLAIGVAGLVLSFGPQVPGYPALSRAFPVLQGIRSPVRFGILALAAVAVLAGFGLARVRERLRGAGRWGSAVGVACCLLVTAEALRAPVGYVPAIPVSEAYAVLALEPEAVLVEYPLPWPEAVFRNAPYMLYSTRHWKPMLNGYSGFMPESYREHWEQVKDFPDRQAIVALARFGVTHVAVHDADIISHADRMPALGRVVSMGGVVIYRLDARLAAQQPGGETRP